ncbi:MAG: S8 family serine peptidase [SAR324 cluster bacterium]|nr:S8 family serine peptidase [SAR324 cluster bacterium]
MKYFLNYGLSSIILALSLIVLNACKKPEEVEKFPLYDYSLIEAQDDDSLLNSKPINYGADSTPSDPHLRYQWHLFNEGQEIDYLSVNGMSNYKSSVLGGNDINVKDVHNADPKIRGVGIVINIVDTSVEAEHEDLRVDIDHSHKFKITNKDIDPYQEVHATMVAGIAAAKSGNNVGGSGVAPAATIINYNLLEVDNQSNDLAESMGLQSESHSNQGSKIADIINMSFGEGESASFPKSFNDYIRQDSFFKKAVFEERKREGVILGYNLVKAAGNGDNENNEKTCTPLYNMPCEDSNQHYLNTIKYKLVVASSRDDGQASSNSMRGSNIFINAPAGEHSLSQYIKLVYGEDILNDKKRFYDFLSMQKPALVVPDLMGCHRGFSIDKLFRAVAGGAAYVIPKNNFESDFAYENNYPNRVSYAKRVERTLDKHHLLNPTCSYTSRANGTSAAAPIISGVIALLLERKPELTWRDVRYILARSAIKTDPHYEGVYVKYTRKTVTTTDPDTTTELFEITPSTKGEVNTSKTYQVLPGWVANKATTNAFNFSNLYGFGRVDAKSAISLVDSFPTMPAEVYYESHHAPFDHDNDANTPELVDHDGNPDTEPITDPNPDPGRKFMESFALTDKSTLAFTKGNFTKNPAFSKDTGRVDSGGAAINKYIFPYLRDADPTKLGDTVPELWAAYHTYNKKIKTIESVTVFVDLCMNNLETLFIRLTSPQGTKSVLLSPFTQQWKGYKKLQYHPFLTNSFYGEDPSGDWYLEVFDASGKIIDKTANPLTSGAWAEYPELNRAMIHFSGMAENFIP